MRNHRTTTFLAWIRSIDVIDVIRSANARPPEIQLGKFDYFCLRFYRLITGAE